MSIGEKIKMLRKQHGLSQESLAIKLNVSRQAITKWETNRGTPDIENLKSISNLFNISLDYLVNGDLEKTSYTMKETINFKEYSNELKDYKCVEDYIVLHKFPQASKICPLIREKMLSRFEKAFEWFFMPFFGAFDIIDKINTKSKNYLIKNQEKLFLVIVCKNTLTTTILPYTTIDKNFVYENYKYTKLDVEGVSELISWAKKNNIY